MVNKLIGEGMIQYANQWNRLHVSVFSLEEKRILMAVIYYCVHNNPYDEIRISRKELLQLGIFPSDSMDSITVDRLKEIIFKFFDRCNNLRFYDVEDNDLILQVTEYSLFATKSFSLNKELKDLELRFRINPWAVPLLTDLFTQYTRFPVREYLGLKSIHSQDLFVNLKQFRSTGVWQVSKDKFFKIMNIPESYRTKEYAINSKILKPAIKELSPYFPGLKVEKLKAGPSAKSKVIGYKFTWKAEKEDWNPRKYIPYPDNHPLKPLSTFPAYSDVQNFLETLPDFPIEAREVYERLLKQANKGTQIHDWRKYVLKMKENELKKKGKTLTHAQRKKEAQKMIKDLQDEENK